MHGVWCIVYTYVLRQHGAQWTPVSSPAYMRDGTLGNQQPGRFLSPASSGACPVCTCQGRGASPEQLSRRKTCYEHTAKIIQEAVFVENSECFLSDVVAMGTDLDSNSVPGWLPNRDLREHWKLPKLQKLGKGCGRSVPPGL